MMHNLIKHISIYLVEKLAISTRVPLTLFLRSRFITVPSLFCIRITIQIKVVRPDSQTQKYLYQRK